MTSAYDIGFCQGIKFIAAHIRLAADRVETPRRGTVENAEGKTFDVITKSGQTAYANKLRDLAAELEKLC